MSVQKVKRRSWGKTRPKEGIAVINRERIEETLKSLDEEAKKPAPKATQEGSGQNAGLNLQYPELMSDEDLVSALKRIKVPIPVYSDGRPSRERLLYLYRTNVLPRPQRAKSSWRTRQGRRRGVAGSQQENSQGGTDAMEVDQDDHSWSLNGGNVDRVIQRKRCV